MRTTAARDDAIEPNYSSSKAFYGSLPVMRGFRYLMDPRRYTPLPDDWLVGIADVVQSTKAIAENRYKAVNMAGAAVIAAVTNALGGRDFPFVFGGDGAAFAISPDSREKAEGALAATASWTAMELGLTLRVSMVPIAEIRTHGLDVCVARYAVSDQLSYAMFSGGGIAWADAAMKRGEFAVNPAPPGTWPDLSGLSCRFQEIKSARGVVLSVLVLPRADADPEEFRALTEEIVAMVERSPNAGRPVPKDGPGIAWPPPGVDLEARTAPGPPLLRRAKVLAQTLLAYVIMRSGIRVGNFVPSIYLRQVVENSDFRKYDDGLRMIIDSTPELADALDRRLKSASRVAFYGIHRQHGAIMTCFTQSALRPDHVHFIDGAQGGYTAAAIALKAARAAKAFD
jgi:Protein of unknown function (DUF3095)